MVKFFRYLVLGAFPFLSGCEQADFSVLYKSMAKPAVTLSSDADPKVLNSAQEIDDLIEGSWPEVDVEAGFLKAIRQALNQDPAVLAAKEEVAASKANLQTTVSGGDTQINTTLLGGIEDVSDETIGVAAILTAERLLYDGGMLDAKIDADTFYSKAADQAYLAKRGERALRLAQSWIELERYEALKDLINNRLEVLEPLLDQLDRVATAGVGDVSQVASAQRIVSSIIVAKTDILEKNEQAKISFVNGFGQLPATVRYDASWVSGAVPKSISNTRKIAKNSPGLLAKYWAYRAAEASVVAIKAQDGFNVGFKLKLQRPLGGSEANSDESIGFVLSRDLYQGDRLKSQVDRAEAVAKVKAAEVIAGFRDGELILLSAREVIKSMDKAIELARINAKRSLVEIDYLRKQLIIGGSTLESVLSAEARLYDAESKEIGFIAERRKAEIKIIAISGHLTKALSAN